MNDYIEVLTRRQFLRRNVLLALALAFLGFPLKALGGTARQEPNVSDKEARFYSKLAG